MLMIGQADPQSWWAKTSINLVPLHAIMLIILVTGTFVTLWPLGFQGDYFNHLARTYILAEVWFDPALREYYELSFSIVPDLAMDLVIPWLSHVIGIYPAGALLAWLGFLAAPLGGIAVARSLHGRLTWTSLGSFLVMFNQSAQWSFINFSLSCGLALFAFAFWIQLGTSWRKSVIFSFIGLVIVFNHALGFLLLGYLILCWELGQFFSSQRGTLAEFIKTLATKLAAAMLPGLAIIFMAMGGEDQLPRAGQFALFVPPKIETFWSAAMFFNPGLALVVCYSLIAFFWIGLRRKFLILDQRMNWVCGGMVLLALLMPVTIMGIWGLHFRFPAITFILLAASVRFRESTIKKQRLTAIGSIALMIPILLNAASVMSKTDRANRSVKEVLQEIPVGTRILPVSSDGARSITTLRNADIAVIEKSAFVPDIFTNTSWVDVVDSMRRQHMPQSNPLTVSELAASARRTLPIAKNGHWSPYYYFGWAEHWDYIIYFHRDTEEDLESPYLQIVSSSSHVSVYEITD